jgi:hypothetical protein
VEEADLAEHRADAAHLEHHPLQGLVAQRRIGGHELAGLLGQVHQDRARFEQRQRLAAGPLGSMIAGILLFGFSDRNSGEVWSFLSKRPGAARRAAVSSSISETLMPLGWERVQLQAVGVLRRPFGGDREVGQNGHRECLSFCGRKRRW